MIPPKDIQAIGTEIAIVWSDGVESFYPMDVLRSLSPSAENRGESDLLGQIHGGTDQVEFPGVLVVGWTTIGSYAVQFDFSDGHKTGIYSFEYLREIWEKLKPDQS